MTTEGTICRRRSMCCEPRCNHSHHCPKRAVHIRFVLLYHCRKCNFTNIQLLINKYSVFQTTWCGSVLTDPAVPSLTTRENNVPACCSVILLLNHTRCNSAVAIRPCSIGACALHALQRAHSCCVVRTRQAAPTSLQSPNPQRDV